MFNRAWFSAAVLFIAFGAPLAHAAITDQAIFVAKTGSDANGGTQASPKQTISAGITAAVAVAIPNVVVSKGVYAEVVNLPNGISLFGGYDATAGWTRAPANTTTIQAASMPLRIQTYSAIGQVDGFTIQATSSGTPGSSTIGILLNNAGGIRISRNVIVAAAGINGTAGNNGPAVLPATAPFGNSGGPGCSGTGCGVGGLGGNSACGAAGGKGGNAGTGSNNGQFGTAGSGAPPGGSPGSGGTAAGCGSLSTPGNPGASGSVGTQGNPGTGGTGGTASPSGWVSAAGTNGSVGTSAKGGGGGGGGGGGQTFAFPSCTDETGGGGGGGGAGGCGGNLGQGGGGGGGSIAILSLNSAAAQIVANNIQAGAGGNGGHGGSGSPGQVGGAGANAGPLFDKAGAGGNGGNGGDGGAGAGGGGGAGGPSNGIFAAGGLGIASNTINTGGPGFGGGGGTTPGGGTAGSGQNGSPAQTSGASTVTPLTLTVAKAGTGAGTVASDVGWIDCGATCSEIYGSGVVVALSATVSVGSTFTGWSGDCTGTGACNVTMDAARTVTATFTLLNPQSITFDALADKPYPSAPFTVSATGGASGNPVVFSSLTTGVCTTSGTNGTTVTIFAAGLCRIAANQAGNGTYAAAPQVTQSFTVTGLFRAYVSKNGSDANPCTLAQPCRLLPAALTLVNEGGEIWMLDSANFNVGTVNVFKSVTVLAVPGALGSVVANGADAIMVNSSTTTELALRNVVIVNLSGAGNYGIRFLQGSQVTLEGSEIYGVDTGILVAAPGGLLTVRDTMIRDTAIQGVVLTGGVTGSLEGVALVNNSGFGIQVIGGAQATFTGGMISGSGTGANVAASGTTTARLTLSATELSDNGTALSVSAAAGADTAHAILEDVTISHNTTGVALSGAGTTAVFSRQNNSLKFNGTDVTGGALTPQAAF